MMPSTATVLAAMIAGVCAIVAGYVQGVTQRPRPEAGPGPALRTVWRAPALAMALVVFVVVGVVIYARLTAGSWHARTGTPPPGTPTAAPGTTTTTPAPDAAGRVAATPAPASPATAGPAVDEPLTFTVPGSGQRVARRLSVELRGSVPAGQTVWVAVRSSGLCFPQGTARLTLPNKWSLNGVTLGSEYDRGDANKSYDLVAVLASPAASSELGVIMAHGAGVTSLPTGAHEATSISVARIG